MTQRAAMQPTLEQIEIARGHVSNVAFLRLLGVQLDTLGDGTAQMSLTIDDKHLQPLGIAHGGVIASLMDSVTWWAARAALGFEMNHPMVSVDLKLNYLSALKPGPAIARATCKKAGARLCYSVGEILDTRGRLVADGASTLMIVSG